MILIFEAVPCHSYVKKNYDNPFNDTSIMMLINIATSHHFKKASFSVKKLKKIQAILEIAFISLGTSSKSLGIFKKNLYFSENVFKRPRHFETKPLLL
jgi:hypothetical protein